MLKICKENWARYSENLKTRLREEYKTLKNTICYKDLVRFAIDEILNVNGDKKQLIWNVVNEEAVTKIDDGDYQGTLLFIVPKHTYQPSSYEYLITYIEYGSCCCCDALEGALDYSYGGGDAFENVIDGLMTICQDIIFNIKRPFYDKYVYAKDDNWAEVE